MAEFGKEAEKLGIILSDDLIKKGSEAEDTFKRLEEQIKATKLSLAGAASNLANFFKDALDFGKDAVSYVGRLGVPGRGISPAAWAGQRPETWPLSAAELYGIGGPEAQAARKVQPPGLGISGMGAQAEIKAFDYMWSAYAEQAKKYTSIVDSVISQHLENIKGDFVDFQTAIAQGWEYIGEAGEISLAKIEELAGAAADSWTRVQGAVYGTGGEYMDVPGTISLDQYLKTMKESDNLMQSIGKSAGELLTSNMVQLMSATGDWGEKFKEVGTSILQTLTQIIAQTMIMNALFGNTKGEYSSGSGLVGIIGSALGGIKIFGDGGVVTSPTLAMIGEGPDDEAVVPLKNGRIPIEGGGGDTIIIINANDAKSFDDMVRRNSESILAVSQRASRMGRRH